MLGDSSRTTMTMLGFAAVHWTGYVGWQAWRAPIRLLRYQCLIAAAGGLVVSAVYRYLLLTNRW